MYFAASKGRGKGMKVRNASKILSEAFRPWESPDTLYRNSACCQVMYREIATSLRS